MTVPIRPVLSVSPRTGALVGGCAVVFVLLTVDVVVGGPASGVDVWMEHRVGAHRSALVAAVSGAGGLGVSAGVLAVLMLVSMHLTWRLRPLLVAVGNAAAMAVIVLLVKTVIGRPGPVFVDSPAGYAGFFPSGHTATAGVCFGTATYLWWRMRRHRRGDPATVGTTVGMVVALAVGVASVAGGYHWFSDALASVALTGVVLPLGFGLSVRRGT